MLLLLLFQVTFSPSCCLSTLCVYLGKVYILLPIHRQTERDREKGQNLLPKNIYIRHNLDRPIAKTNSIENDVFSICSSFIYDSRSNTNNKRSNLIKTCGLPLYLISFIPFPDSIFTASINSWLSCNCFLKLFFCAAQFTTSLYRHIFWNHFNFISANFQLPLARYL